MKFTVVIDWFTDNEDIEETLLEDGIDRAYEQIKEGMNQGQLVYEDDAENITGWWSLNKEED